jgi:hypothetical protein
MHLDVSLLTPAVLKLARGDLYRGIDSTIAACEAEKAEWFFASDAENIPDGFSVKCDNLVAGTQSASCSRVATKKCVVCLMRRCEECDVYAHHLNIHKVHLRHSL